MNGPMKALHKMAKGKTQQKLAEDLGANASLLNGVLRGKRPITKNLAMRLGFKSTGVRWVRV